MAERIVVKRGWFWTMLHWCVCIVTFGRNRRFLTNYWTTIGPIIAIPLNWDMTTPLSRVLLAHERWHVRQQERAGFGNAWIGMIPWGLFWLFGPLPIGLSWGRYVLERSAYVEGFRVQLRLASEAGEDVKALRIRLIDFAVEQLTTAAYGWAWPFPHSVRRWLEERVPWG